MYQEQFTAKAQGPAQPLLPAVQKQPAPAKAATLTNPASAPPWSPPNTPNIHLIKSTPQGKGSETSRKDIHVQSKHSMQLKSEDAKITFF